MPVTKTEAIANVLKARALPDLAALYTGDMECQVNVAQDGGQRTEGDFNGRRWQGWSDGTQTWKAFRIPRNANTEPEFMDTNQMFDLGLHAEAIGMTGWNWKKRISQWVAFDFDAITGHSDKHSKRLTDEQLLEIRKTLEAIPWVTLRKSTSGRGLHVYVFIDPVATKNHTEHAALARAILGKLSSLTGSNLETKVDVCGQNMWVWHRKMTKLNEGLLLLKQGTVLVETPLNWRDHIKVITGHRRKTLPKFLDESDSKVQQSYDDLANQLTRVPLDEEHKKLISYLEKIGSWWDADHHMLVSHTYWFKQAHAELSLRGKFQTESAGTEAPSDINSFAFPLRRGGWAIRRYSPGVHEHESWEQDGRGWTRCFYNTDPTLISTSKGHGGLEDPSGGFIFNEAAMALEALRLLGASVGDIPSGLLTETAKLKSMKDGRVVIEIDGDKGGALAKAGEMKGWLHKKGKWSKIVNISAAPQLESEGTTYDDQVRHIATNNGDDAGWALKIESGQWVREPLTHVQNVLHSMGLKPPEVKTVVGNSIMKAWRLVNQPFQPEYPGNRVWNEKAAQFRFPPSQNDTFVCNHWKMILNHVGAGLDSALKGNAWAQANGVITGADYLKLWVASLFKEPLEPLPYLFLYGPQNSGKSIFHEALSLLFTRGYVRADAALTSQGNFNGELANAVLCVVEEINLRRDKNAANRIKDWVTARDLSVHAKGQTPYQITNSTHWIQVSNESSACPVLPGDTRITTIFVPDFEDITQKIPKKEMMIALEKEASDFLGEVLSLEIPPSNDRLNVPVIRTAEKADLEASNRTPVEQFFAEKLYPIDGQYVLFSHMYEQFLSSLDPAETVAWTKHKFSKEIPPQYPKGRMTTENSHLCIGNVSFESSAERKAKYVPLPPDKNDFVFLGTNAITSERSEE